MAAKLAAGLKWFVVGVIDSFMVMLLLMKAFFGSSLAREHRPSFGKLFKGWQTCRYFGRNLGRLVDSNTHTAGSTFNHALSALNVNGIEVLHLYLGDFAQLGTRNRANLRLIRRSRSFFNTNCFFQQVSYRRRFRNEGK